jgi:GNAT superfamily N-acetyltransferase
MPSDTVSTIHETYVSRYKKNARSEPDGEIHQCGPITIASLGGPHPMLNIAFVFEPPAADDLEAAVEWIAASDVPFWLHVADPALSRVADLAADLGLTRSDASFAGMVRPSLGDLPRDGSDAAIAPVTIIDGALAFNTVFDTVFDIQRADDSHLSSGGADAAARSHPYVGRMDGQVVATGAVYRVGDNANVSGVAVRKGYRGQGIGTGMCGTVLRDARENGCRMATLESPPVTVPFYESLGFETAVTYHIFTAE